MEPELATLAAQFGVAGLIGWMWLSERRTAQERDRQLADAHAALSTDRTSIDILLRALDANTKAITNLEAAQHRLITALERSGCTQKMSSTEPNKSA